MEKDRANTFFVQVGSRVDLAGPDDLDKVTARLQRKEPGRKLIVRPLAEIRLGIQGDLSNADHIYTQATAIKKPR